MCCRGLSQILCFRLLFTPDPSSLLKNNDFWVVEHSIKVFYCQVSDFLLTLLTSKFKVRYLCGYQICRWSIAEKIYMLKPPKISFHYEKCDKENLFSFYKILCKKWLQGNFFGVFNSEVFSPIFLVSEPIKDTVGKININIRSRAPRQNWNVNFDVLIR